jgi:peroxiredoxin
MSTLISRRTSLLLAGFLTFAGFSAMADAPGAGTAGTPAVGTPAPAFRLQDQNGEWHSLADYKGKWVALYFYPKDDTPGCTTQACSFRDNVFAFKKEGAVILGVSVDDVASHKAFEQKHGLPFTLLADPGRRCEAVRRTEDLHGRHGDGATRHLHHRSEGRIAALRERRGGAIRRSCSTIKALKAGNKRPADEASTAGHA